MADVLAYALSRATEDVADTIRWLQSEGFVLRSHRGGPDEAFGNVLLEFGRQDVMAWVVRDRSQWSIDLGGPGAAPQPLVAHLRAMGEELTAPAEPSFDDPLPDQLPEGTEWRTAVPRVIAWLEPGK